jgi:NAD(P)-dependent dehydrogenase (short-subunit alcohol dehydrogenase family)
MLNEFYRTGLGRELALAALKRGDKVIATSRARSISGLGDLQAQGADVLELDVTSPLEELREIAKKAIAFHGRVDVLVNNAG